MRGVVKGVANSPAPPFVAVTVCKMDSFAFTPGQALQVTSAMKQQFEKNGYILVRYVAVGVCREEVHK